jgi:hypothetical protein
MRTRSDAACPETVAFSRLELLVTLGAIGLLAIVAVPSFGATKASSNRAVCVNNLSRIGQAFRQWSTERGDLNPYLVPSPTGLLNHPSGLQGNLFIHFSVISNELINARVLSCPSDGARVVANDFTASPGGLLNPSYRNNAISYFLGHPHPANGREPLAGDRNISGATNVVTCQYFFLAQAFSADAATASWNNLVHVNSGQVLFSDGSVEQTDNATLPKSMGRANADAGDIHILR